MAKSAHVLDLLRSGIPLSLLMDLACASGPDSVAIARNEASTSALHRSTLRRA